MRRVACVITARPSYSRIKSALASLRLRPDVQLRIVAAASSLVTRYGCVVDQIRADGFEIAAEVPSVIDGDTLADSALSTGVLLTQMAGTLDRLKPDVVVTIADRHETLATAIAASYQHIPLCHIQGGEITGSIDDKVRNAVTQLADIHCVSSEQAAVRVNRMKPGAEIHVTGCPSIDIAREALRLGPLGDPGFVVLQHSVTDEADKAAEQMQTTVDALKGWKSTFFWPGEDAGNGAMAKVLRQAGIKAIRNLPPVEFLRTLMAADALVGNSSVGIRECAYLGVPVVDIGTRQQGRQRAGNVFEAPHDKAAIRQVASYARLYRGKLATSDLYGDGKAGQRIADVLTRDRKREAA